MTRCGATCWLAIVLTLGDAPWAGAGERTVPGPPLPRFRNIYVPADAPGEWPAGDWEPWSSERLHSVLLQLKQGAAAAQTPPLSRAEYSAVLTGDSLQHGEFRFRLANSAATTRFVSLEPLSLPIADLSWDPEAAPQNPRRRAPLWGRASDGRIGIITETAAGTLLGTWGLDGVRKGQSVDFRFELAPSTLSSLTFTVPVGVRPSSSAGVWNGPVAGSAGGGESWRLDLGHVDRVRVRFTQMDSPPHAHSLLIARPDFNFVVRPEATRFRAAFDVSVWENPCTEFLFTLPAEADIASVVYGDEAADWSRDPQNRSLIHLRLPGPVLGELRRIEFQGVLQSGADSEWRLPTFRLESAVEIEGHLGVRLPPSFRAAALEASGLRQVDMTVDATDGEKFEFRRLRPDAMLRFVAASQPARLNCRAIGLISLSDDLLLQTLLEWTASDGRTWSAACRIPQDWEVVDVRLPIGEGSDRTIDWSVETTSDEGHRLVFQFAEALTPAQPLRVQATLRSRGSAAVGKVPLPLITPEPEIPFDDLILVASDRPVRPDPQAELQFERLNLAQLPADALAVDFIRSALSRNPAELFGLRSRQSGSRGTLDAAFSAGSPAGKPAGSAPPAPAGSAPAETPSGGRGGVILQNVAVAVEISGARDGFDVYRLEARLVGSPGVEMLDWSLDQRCEPPVAFLNGQPATPSGRRADFRQGILLAAPEPGETGESHQLSLRYRVPASAGWGPIHRRLTLPVFAAPVVTSRIELSLPDSLILAEAPPGFQPTPSSAGPSVLGSHLGIFARPATDARFNPLAAADWRTLVLGKSADSGDSLQRIERWSLSVIGFPRQPEFAFWNRLELRAICWWCFLAALWVGMTSQLRTPAPLQGLLTFAIALCTASVLLLPGVFTDLGASLLAGLLAALLIPSSWLRTLPRRREFLGSTPSAPRLAVNPARLFVWLVLPASLGIAAVSNPIFGQIPPAGAGKLTADDSPVFDLLIPVSDPAPSRDENRIIYASTALRAHLDRLLSRQQTPDYLMTEAAYQVLSDDLGRPFIEARLKIGLAARGPVQIALPFSGLHLIDGGCHVNGIPCDLAPATAGPGFILSWVGEPESQHPGYSFPERSDRPAPPALPDSPDEPAAELISVVLKLLPEYDEGAAVVSRFKIPRMGRIEYPPSSRSGLSPGRATLPAARFTAPARETNRAIWTADAGELELRSLAAAAPHRPDPLKADVVVLVELDPSLATVRTRLRYSLGPDPVDWLALRLPPGMAVTSVRGASVWGHQIQPFVDGERRLLIDLEPPQSEAVDIAVDLVIPLTRGPFELQFPDPAVSTDDTRPAVELRSYRVALQTPLDRRVLVSSPVVDQPVRTGSIDDFVRDGRFGETVPQQAYELDRPLALVLLLDALEPRLEGQFEQRGVVQATRLDWTLDARDLRSTQTLFQYVVDVDPRLEVRSASVTEQGVERLARWARDGNAVTLFLSSRPSRSQRLTISGSMNMPAGTETVLPNMSVRGVKSPTERRILLAAPGIDVILSGASPQKVDQPQSPVPRVLWDDLVAVEQSWPTVTSVILPTPGPASSHLIDPLARDPQLTSPDPDTELADPADLEVEFAQLELQRQRAGDVAGLLRFWIPEGPAIEIPLRIPAGATVTAVAWQDRLLPLSRTPEGAQVAAIPERRQPSQLLVLWTARSGGAADIPDRLWRPFPEVVWANGLKVARLVVSTGWPSNNWISPGPMFRRLSVEAAREFLDDMERKTGESENWSILPGDSPRDHFAASVRATSELDRHGRLAGFSLIDWSRGRPFVAACVFALALLSLWWFSGLIEWLQERTGLCLLIFGVVWWAWLVAGGLGCLLAMVSLPWAMLDLTRQPPAGTRTTIA